ncbi:Response regulator of the LytR/AlgR family protein [Roseibium album]|nr:Response regulator of the LytR/AlgR family protein [Roseibium album]
MIRNYALQISFLALATALLLASTQTARPENWSLAGLYSYWVVRILIEAGLFVAFAELIGRLAVLKDRPLLVTVLAAFVSLFPFVLSITALDLILGLPELGGAIGFAPDPNQTLSGLPSEPRIGSFLVEVIYLTDNHLALCLLMSAPKLFKLAASETAIAPQASRSETALPEQTDHQTQMEEGDRGEPNVSENLGKGYLRHMDQPLEGSLLRVEAQEHYVRLVGQFESRMMLYRFNDIVSELSSELGMQVHRSHWVAFDAMERLLRENGRLWLSAKDGIKIPVSRKYVEEVRSHIAIRAKNAKKAIS